MNFADISNLSNENIKEKIKDRKLQPNHLDTLKAWHDSLTQHEKMVRKGLPVSDSEKMIHKEIWELSEKILRQANIVLPDFYKSINSDDDGLWYMHEILEYHPSGSGVFDWAEGFNLDLWLAATEPGMEVNSHLPQVKKILQPWTVINFGKSAPLEMYKSPIHSIIAAHNLLKE